MTVSEAARRLGVWPNSVRRWIETGYLEAFRIEGKGWHVYVDVEQVETLALMRGTRT